MSDSVQPHRRQPTRFPCPWDSPGKNTGVGCHFILQCMKLKSEREVTQSCPTLSDPMDCSPPGSLGFSRQEYWSGVPLPSPTSIHNYPKNHSFDYMDLCWQSAISVFNMLSSFVIAFLPRSKSLLISWLQAPSAVILEPKKIKAVTVSIVSPSICHEVMGPDAMILVFGMLSSRQHFLSPFSPSTRGSLVLLHFLPLEWYYLHI